MMMKNTIATINTVVSTTSSKSRREKRRFTTMSNRPPAAPMAPDCGGVAQPKMMEPRTRLTKPTGSTRPRARKPSHWPSDSGLASASTPRRGGSSTPAAT